MTFIAARPSQPRPDSPEQRAEREFDLVESSAGWELTITLTDQLREALAHGGSTGSDVTFTVRVSPNLVPGEPFTARLRIAEPTSDDGGDRSGRPRPQPL
jgi:hypothetical protein